MDGRTLRILASADVTETKINDGLYSDELKDVPKQVSIYEENVDKRPVRELSPIHFTSLNKILLINHLLYLLPYKIYGKVFLGI